MKVGEADFSYSSRGQLSSTQAHAQACAPRKKTPHEGSEEEEVPQEGHEESQKSEEDEKSCQEEKTPPLGSIAL
ncbi:hypothetical protein Aduo_016993 [Ancylostoma duodenale]